MALRSGRPIRAELKEEFDRRRQTPIALPVEDHLEFNKELLEAVDEELRFVDQYAKLGPETAGMRRRDV